MRTILNYADEEYIKKIKNKAVYENWNLPNLPKVF